MFGGDFNGWCCGSCKQLRPTPYCMVGFTQTRKGYAYKGEEFPEYYYRHNNAIGLVPCVYGVTFSDINLDYYFGSIVDWNNPGGEEHSFKCYYYPDSLPFWDGTGIASALYTVSSVNGTELNIDPTKDTYTDCREVFDNGNTYWTAKRLIQDGAEFGWLQIAKVIGDNEDQEEWNRTFVLNPTVAGDFTGGGISFASVTSNRAWYGGGADFNYKYSADWEAGPHCAIVWNNWGTGGIIYPGRVRYALYPEVTVDQAFVPVSDCHHVQTSTQASIDNGRIVFVKPIARHAPLCIGIKFTETATDVYSAAVYVIDWRDPTTYWAPEDGSPASSGFQDIGGTYAAKGWRTDNPEIVGGAPMFTLTGLEESSITPSIILDAHIRNGRVVVLLNNSTYYDTDNGFVSLHSGDIDDSGEGIQNNPSAIHIGTDGEVITSSYNRVRKYVDGISQWQITADQWDFSGEPYFCGSYSRPIGVKITSNDGGYCVKGFKSSASLATAFTQDNLDNLYPGETDAPFLTSKACVLLDEWWDNEAATSIFYNLGYDIPFASNLGPQQIIDDANAYGVLGPFNGCTFANCMCPSNVDYDDIDEVYELQQTEWTIGYFKRAYSRNDSYGLSVNLTTPYDYWIFTKDGSHISPCRRASKTLTTKKGLADAVFFDAYSAIEHRFIQPGLRGSSVPMPIYGDISLNSDMSETVSCPLTGF